MGRIYDGYEQTQAIPYERCFRPRLLASDAQAHSGEVATGTPEVSYLHADGSGNTTRLTDITPPQGFSSDTSAATVILTASHFGFPLSTTHVINGGVMGAGAGKRLSAVRWGVAGNIVVAWLLTLPAAGAIGALTYGLTRIFGTGALGPAVVTLMAISLIVAAFARRAQRGAPVPAAGG